MQNGRKHFKWDGKRKQVCLKRREIMGQVIKNKTSDLNSKQEHDLSEDASHLGLQLCFYGGTLGAHSPFAAI
jgi:hypothetical protein